MKATSALALLAVVLAGPAACVTVNIYFPAPQVRAAAEQIVEETWGDVDGAPIGSPDTAPASASGPGAWLRHLGPRSAWAAENDPDINVSTAAIRALKTAMKDRAQQIKPYLTAGNVGVANTGMLVTRDLAGVAFADQAKIRRLVEAENRDRQALYSAIAEANGFGPERVSDIQKIFAETWIDKAETGWPVQNSRGAWSKK